MAWLWRSISIRETLTLEDNGRSSSRSQDYGLPGCLSRPRLCRRVFFGGVRGGEPRIPVFFPRKYPGAGSGNRRSRLDVNTVPRDIRAEQSGAPLRWIQFAILFMRPPGNNYSVPDGISGCLQSATNVDGQLACLDPQDFVDSVLSLDLEDGRINWGRRFQGADTFIYTCAIAVVGGVPCPDPAGLDYDFGAGANLFTITEGGRAIDVVGAGQKSGTYWVMNASTGDLLWATQVGPGGLFGGIEWGVAMDGQRIYAAIGNLTHVSYTLAPAHTVTVNAGSWAA